MRGEQGADSRADRSVVPLLWVWFALVVYASLYPFAGWRIPVSASAAEWLVLPWPRRWTAFDAVSNLLGYLPLGTLGFIVARQHGRAFAGSMAAAVAGGALLSLAMEELQNFLPQRVPSRMDWALNIAGTALGALVAAALLALLPRRAAAGVGLVALTALVALVARAPADPYYAHSLHEWAQGRFIRFHGVAQWVGWFWPYAAMLYLLVRLGARDRDAAT